MARRRKQSKKVTITNSTIEGKVERILQSLNVSYQPQASIDKYTVDFLVNEKYIVECYGDYWHCNPHRYTSSYYNKGKKKTAEEIWDRDTQRKEHFERLGYKFLCIWETEINSTPNVVRSKIKRNVNLE
jgi:very-short-patch-repair endonuclease